MRGDHPRPAEAPTPEAIRETSPVALVGAEWTAVAILVMWFVWRGLWPAWKTLNTDFPNYYLAAKLRQAGFPLDRMYEWIWFQRQKDHFALDQDLVGSIESTPFSGLLMAPLVWLPALAAKRVWLTFNLALLAMTGYLLARLSRLPARRILLVVFLALVPLRTNSLYGQQHVVVLFLLTLAAWLSVRERPLSSGIVLAAATVLKLYPGLLVLHLLSRRRWRALLGFTAAFAALTVVGLVLCGVEPFRVYVVDVLPRLLKGEGNDPYLATLNSPTVLLRRLLIREPQLNPSPLFHRPFLFAVLQPAVQAAILTFTVGRLMSPRLRPSADDRLDIATYVVLMLLLSPGSSTYHFCALILPAALILGHLVHTGDKARALVFAGLYFLVCSPIQRVFPAQPAGAAIFLGFPRLYALAALWMALLAALWRAGQAAPPRLQRRHRILTGVAFAISTLVGAASQSRHMAGQSLGASQLTSGTTPALIATSPAAAGAEHLYYVRMDRHSYVLDRTHGALRLTMSPGVDAFHPTFDLAGDGWFEMASTTSRIVRLPDDSDPRRGSDLGPTFEDAEDPVSSADGRTLAFIRPTAGRGALWLAELATGRLDPGPARVREVVPARDDVLEFAFAPGNKGILSARPDGRPVLLQVDLRTGVSRPIENVGSPARYPALSGDGRWLAYSQEEHGSWHLHLIGLATGEARRLTTGDCNSFCPSWSPDGRTITFATDCGRGYGQTTLAQIQAVP